MKKIIAYIIVINPPELAVDDIQKSIKLGFQPFGSPFSAMVLKGEKSQLAFVQAMVKYEE